MNSFSKISKVMKTETQIIPFSKPYFSKEELDALKGPIESGWVTQGIEVEKFEKTLSELCEVEYAISVNSGTSALHLSLLAHNVGSGDEVICPSYSFIATANSIKLSGATPIFTDVDINTANMDPDLTEKYITKKTKALMVVHQFGTPVDIDGFRELANKHKLILIQDSACAIGSTYKNKSLSTWGDISCLSFHPRKIITTGEGGVVLTNDSNIAKKVRELRSHGSSILNKNANLTGKHEEYLSFGFNFRLSDLNAAVGNIQIKKLDEILLKRTEIANKYLSSLSIYKDKIAMPVFPNNTKPNYQTFQIRILTGSKKRDFLISTLANSGISTRAGIPPIHKQIVYSKLAEYKTVSLPNTELLSKEGLCLPLFPALNSKDQEYIIQKLVENL